MARSSRDFALELADRWEHEAFGYENRVRRGDYVTPVEKRLLEMHARVKLACAQELRSEALKVRHD